MSQEDNIAGTAERPAAESGVSVNGAPISQHAGMGGAYEGADRIGREMGTWTTPIKSPDAEINRDKPTMDARGQDLVRNTGLMQGASSIHKDSIVGALFRLNAKPNYKILGQDKKWADKFSQEVEAKFSLYAESQDNWLDAGRMMGLTMQVRLAIASFFMTGEVVSTVEWLRDAGRPFNTAMQMVDPHRVSNPQDTMDTATLRRGIERNQYGAPQAYWFRMAFPNDPFNFQEAFTWKRVPIRKPWGRLQVVHINDPLRPDQTRGVAEMVSVLKEMRMTKKFHEVTLQNAVVNASYAATIESDLPPDQAFDAIGATDSASQIGYATQLLQAIAQYTGTARNLEIDGVKIPHLFPGTKLNLKPMGSPGGVGAEFEQSLLRYVASALGLSYEQFSRDYTKTNYSSARASMNETWKYMQSRKMVVADRYAGIVYSLWLEEAINKGLIDSLPKGFNLYEGQNKDAICNSTWIGASRGQVDELKETQAALMRIKGGLSTYEEEAGKLGKDFRDLFEQQASEQAMMEELGLEFDTNPTKGGTMSSQRGKSEDAGDAEEE